MLAVASASATIHHDLAVRFHLDSGEIEVSDRVTLPEAAGVAPEFVLAAGLQARAHGGELVELPMPGSSGLRRYRFQGELADGALMLHYRGRVADGRRRDTFDMPLAAVDEQGVYLDGSSAWYPRFADAPRSYRLRARLPDGWQGVSVGAQDAKDGVSVWRAEQPQEDIYLLAAPFSRYRCETPVAAVEVYLRAPDEALAQGYLQNAARYLALYDGLLGNYPYTRFAVVENRWQTGYGMPSFTLLGSRVLRLPFILHSSLPHEILHNWWGNSVWLALGQGNWSEGLTAYLADHLLKELAGDAAEYRRKALERYANFAATGRDLPLQAFRSRHDEASQAVGYSKALMLFHMVRRELGDGAFVAALRDFYRDYRFRPASFGDLLQVFGAHGLTDPEAFARHWLARPGAPVVALQRASRDGTRLTLELAQTQPGDAYPLRVPVAVTLAGEPTARWLQLPMSGAAASASWSFDSPPLRVDVDPAFELFRQLQPGERPASLGRLFGSPRQILVLPSAAPPAERLAWQRLAEAWQQRYGNVEVREDRAFEGLPHDAAVWLLGWENALLAEHARRFAAAAQTLQPDGARVHGEPVVPERQALVLLDPEPDRAALGFVGARGADAIARLAAKLSHYGSYGRLLFDLPAVDNRLRETLPVARSPLSRVLGERAVPLRLPEAPRLTAQLPDPEAWRRTRCE